MANRCQAKRGQIFANFNWKMRMQNIMLNTCTCSSRPCPGPTPNCLLD